MTKIEKNIYDVIVIGSGPGGYVTAIRAAQLGLKTAICEREYLGGICLNWGCIPTKALLKSAEIKDKISKAQEYGLSLSTEVKVDLPAVIQRSRSISQRLNQGVDYLLKKNKIDIIWGEAKLEPAQKNSNLPANILVSPYYVQKNKPQHPLPKNTFAPGRYFAKHIIIATGARPKILSVCKPDEEKYWSYFEALNAKALKKKLLILGSGAIGMEFASFYHSMGSEVTIVEVLDEIMPAEDHEVSKFVRQKFEKRGIKILTNTKFLKSEKKENGVQVTLERNKKEEILNFDCVLSAIGVQGNIENLGLEELKIETKNSTIVTDEWGRTNVKGIYAIGDVAGAPMLAHKAEEEGVICVEKIANHENVQPLNKEQIPGCTYCTPQVASVGLTEKKAREKNIDIKVGRYNFSANGKAIAMGEDQGFVKLIFDSKTGQLLGAHMVGAEVTELIQGCVIAMNLETTEEELFKTIFPHPTLSEMIKESALDAYGRVLNA